MKKSYFNKKKCVNSLKYNLIEISSQVLASNCMDKAKRKIKSKVISAVKAEMKKMIVKRMKLS